MGASLYDLKLTEDDVDRLIDSLNYQARLALDVYISEFGDKGESPYAAVLWDEYSTYVALAHKLESVLPE